MISYAEAIRLKCALKLTPVELAILVTVMDSEEPVIRSRVFHAARDAGPGAGTMGNASFSVLLCRLNAKLPVEARITPIYPGGGAKMQKGRRGAFGAVFYELTQGRETLLSLASEPKRKPSERAA